MLTSQENSLKYQSRAAANSDAQSDFTLRSVGAMAAYTGPLEPGEAVIALQLTIDHVILKTNDVSAQLDADFAVLWKITPSSEAAAEGLDLYQDRTEWKQCDPKGTIVFGDAFRIPQVVLPKRSAAADPSLQKILHVALLRRSRDQTATVSRCKIHLNYDKDAAKRSDTKLPPRQLMIFPESEMRLHFRMKENFSGRVQFTASSGEKVKVTTSAAWGVEDAASTRGGDDPKGVSPRSPKTSVRADSPAVRFSGREKRSVKTSSAWVPELRPQKPATTSKGRGSSVPKSKTLLCTYCHDTFSNDKLEGCYGHWGELSVDWGFFTRNVTVGCIAGVGVGVGIGLISAPLLLPAAIVAGGVGTASGTTVSFVSKPLHAMRWTCCGALEDEKCTEHDHEENGM